MTQILLSTTGLIWADENGQDLLEYALFAAFIAVIAATAIPVAADFIGTALSKVISAFSEVAANLTAS